MPYVITVDRPIFWAVGDPVVEAGLTLIGDLTVTGLSMISNMDENTFLGAVAGHAGSYHPLPDSGWLETGDIYSYAGGLVIVRQSHNRTLFAPEETPDLFSVYRVDGGDLDWFANERVYIGTRRLFEGVLYASLRDMTTQVDQWPSKDGILGTLWGVVPTTAEWAVGVLYHVGDHVTYGGFEWVCGQQHTSISTWYPGAPGVYLWTKV